MAFTVAKQQATLTKQGSPTHTAVRLKWLNHVFSFLCHQTERRRVFFFRGGGPDFDPEALTSPKRTSPNDHHPSQVTWDQTFLLVIS